ncbi:MAG TPA: transposase [Puia sp.]|jgi:REP element-mobilizing transposase RayT
MHEPDGQSAPDRYPTVYLFVHIIWAVNRREALLTKPVRRILFQHMQKDGKERGLRVIAVGGAEDHIHCLVQLMPSQNLVQVVRSIRNDSAAWLNENKLLAEIVEWEEWYAAYSVSPSGVKQVLEYIGKQEDYHKTKTLADELEIFGRVKDSLA